VTIVIVNNEGIHIALQLVIMRNLEEAHSAH